MKNLLKLLFIFFSISIFSQEKRNGISYQALIINPIGEELPGYNNQNSPLVNTNICLEFIFKDENGTIEYSEYQTVTTDQYGMVNIVIGSGGVFAGGYAGSWNGIVWSEKSKSLVVNLDTTGACTDFTEISNQELTAVPFALFAPGQEGLDGEDGTDGKSAYEIWLDDGNEGTEQDFLDSLKGTTTLIKTSDEEPGNNCKTGGVKIDYGEDTNKNGILDEDEIDASLTKYICDGILNDGTEKGNTTFWDGEKWVVDNNQLYNDGTNVMIGTSNVVSSSAFTIQSTTKGVLISRMTQSQKDAIESPSNGLLVYQTDGTSGFYYYDGSLWTPLKSQSSSSGNASDSNTLIYTVSGF